MSSGVTDEQVRVRDWRLLSLFQTYSKLKEPLTFEDVEQLTRIADGEADLHEACDALAKGCPLETAVNLYT